ncbi:MAG: hypothetical protein V3R22_04215, partial [Kiloniellales bacterium]
HDSNSLVDRAKWITGVTNNDGAQREHVCIARRYSQDKAPEPATGAEILHRSIAPPAWLLARFLHPDSKSRALSAGG